MSKEQIVDLMRVNDQVEAIFDKINDMLATKDFSDLDLVLEMRDKLFDTIVEAIKSQLRRINDVPSAGTRAGGALPHDPQRDEDDDAPVAQPAQIAAIFSGGQKIMPIRHRADNPPKPSFEKESFKKRRVTKMQRVRHFSETTDPYLCTVKTGEPDSQVGFRLHK